MTTYQPISILLHVVGLVQSGSTVSGDHPTRPEHLRLPDGTLLDFLVNPTPLRPNDALAAEVQHARDTMPEAEFKRFLASKAPEMARVAAVATATGLSPFMYVVQSVAVGDAGVREHGIDPDDIRARITPDPAEADSVEPVFIRSTEQTARLGASLTMGETKHDTKHETRITPDPNRPVS